jgi:hypothetical protein
MQGPWLKQKSEDVVVDLRPFPKQLQQATYELLGEDPEATRTRGVVDQDAAAE